MAKQLIITITIDEDGMEEMGPDETALLDLSHEYGITNAAYENLERTVATLAPFGEVEFRTVV